MSLILLGNDPCFSVSVLLLQSLCLSEMYLNLDLTGLPGELARTKFFSSFGFVPCQKYWDRIIFDSKFSCGQN